MVLHLGEQNLIAGLKIDAAPRVGTQINRLGGVAGKDDAASGGRMDESGRALAHRLIGRRRLLGKRVQPAVDVGVVAAVVVDERVDDLARLLRRRRVVEIDEGFVVNLAVQDRKILSDTSDV